MYSFIHIHTIQPENLKEQEQQTTDNIKTVVPGTDSFQGAFLVAL